MDKEKPKKNIPETMLAVNDFLASRRIINPRRDWKVLLAVLSLFIVFDLIFDFTIYQKISNGEMYVNVPQGEIKVETLETDKIKNLINDYESRKAEMSKLGIKNLVDLSD